MSESHDTLQEVHDQWEAVTEKIDRGECPAPGCGQPLETRDLTEMPERKRWPFINEVQSTGGHSARIRTEPDGHDIYAYHWPTKEQYETHRSDDSSSSPGGTFQERDLDLLDALP